MTRKSVKRGLEGGGWKSAGIHEIHGNSLAAYPTARPVRRGPGASNGLWLSDQTAIGFSASDNYTAGLGYWYGIGEYRLYLPLVLRD